jgi:hypothetical protein
MKKKVKPDVWGVAELEEQIKSCILPDAPFCLDQCTTITDIPLFIQATITTVRHNNGNPYFRPYFDRLEKFKNIITK